MKSEQNLRVVLLTRTSRPSGAQMAQALADNGVCLAGIVAERRLRLVVGTKGLWKVARESLGRHGLRVIVNKLWEQVRIQWRKLLGLRSPHELLSIEQWAARTDIPFFIVDDHNDLETRKLIAFLRPDLLVVCNTRKLAPQTFRLAPRGALNMHLSLLPRYAGLDSVFWALYHREREIGFSIHKVAEGLDAGDVLTQEKMALREMPPEEGLYRDLVEAGCQAMARVVLDLETYESCARRQDPKESQYFSWPLAQQRRWYRDFQGQLCQRQPLKILHLITRMVRGGAQENTLATVAGLRARGYNAILATGPSEGPEGSMEEDIHRAGIPWMKWDFMVRQPTLWKDLRTLLWLIRWMREEKFLIVHTHTSKAGVLGRIAAFAAGVPAVVHTPHGHVFDGYFHPLFTRLIIWIERFLARRTDRIVSLTVKEKEEHLKMGIGRESQFVTIPSGVRVKDFNPEGSTGREIRREFQIPEGAKVIGTVARLVPVKGVEHLLDAFKILSAARKDLYCLVVGDGPQMGRLADLASAYGLAQKVIFAGYRKDVAQAIAAMDVFVMASLNEGMGRAVVQAGLMRKPIVASAVSGIRDLVRQEENGLLVKPADPEGLAEAVRRLMDNSALSSRLGYNAREIFKDRYGEEFMVEDIMTLYQDVLRQKGIPRNWLEEVPSPGQAQSIDRVGREVVG